MVRFATAHPRLVAALMVLLTAVLVAADLVNKITAG